jgi:triacylglycerol esterase/lipase EstA (alpha/beta hydrolase family)
MLPVILAHGYLGFGKLGPFPYFNNVKQMLAQGGIEDVHATDVMPKGSLDTRSQELAAQIRQLVPNGKVNVIAHSMGGLDSRYLIARGGRDIIQTLITLGTPFRGTLAADIAVDPRKLARVSPASLLASIAAFVAATTLRWPLTAAADTHFAITELREAVGKMATGDYSQLGSYFSGLFSLQDPALQELTTENCARLFPSDGSDLAGVTCYSFAGKLAPADVSPALIVPALVLSAAGQANDGVVPVDSATLPRFLGALDSDHLGLIGWTARDVSGCYRQICQTLQAQ